MEPATREVTGPHGRDVLEPRVMMVLVALAQAQGRTVSRDMLIARCWAGVAVSDDAINRVIGRLRKLADASAAFSVETITRVGYRLTAREPAEVTPVPSPEPAPIPAPEPAPVPPLAPPRRPLPRRELIAGAGVLVAGGIAAALIGRRGDGDATGPADIDAATATLVQRGMDGVLEYELGRQQQGLALLREAAVRAPQSAAANGGLALGLAQMTVRVPMRDQPEWLRQCRAAAARALTIDPRQPEALVAQALVTPMFGNWPARDAADLRALASAKAGKLAGFRLIFLSATGRQSEIVALANGSLNQDPAAIPARYHLAHALWGLGRMDEADRASADALRLFPGNFYAWFQRAYFLLYAARLPEANALIADRSGWPRGIPEADVNLCARMARALEDPAGKVADAVMAEYETLARQGRGYLENAVRLAAALDRRDTVYRLLEHLYQAPLDQLPAASFPSARTFGFADDRRTDLLFYPPVSRLAGEARFTELLARTGLIDYWRSSGHHPDYCRLAPAACAGIALGSTRL